jgi:hypothetical protein
MNPRGVGYAPTLYVYGEGQWLQGSKGQEHLQRTRGKAHGMRRQRTENRT